MRWNLRFFSPYFLWYNSLMPLTEFTIIENYFHRPKKPAKNVVVGIGDDAAVIEIPKEQQVVISVDTLVEGVHFPINTPPRI